MWLRGFLRRGEISSIFQDGGNPRILEGVLFKKPRHAGRLVENLLNVVPHWNENNFIWENFKRIFSWAIMSEFAVLKQHGSDTSSHHREQHSCNCVMFWSHPAVYRLLCEMPLTFVHHGGLVVLLDFWISQPRFGTPKICCFGWGEFLCQGVALWQVFKMIKNTRLRTFLLGPISLILTQT